MKCSDRFVDPALLGQGRTEVGVGGRVVRAENERLPDQLRRKVMPPDLMSDNAQVMQGIGMVRLRGEDLPIERLGLSEAPGLVMLKGQREGLWVHGEKGGFTAHQRCHRVR